MDITLAKTPLHPNFGLKISGQDVSRFNGAQIEDIRRDLDTYGMLLFPRQTLEDHELGDFCMTVGAGKLDESARKVSHSRQYKKVSYLTNLRDDEGNPLGFSGNTTDLWHSDQEFRLNPATLASLYCIVPSPVGGSTSFASTKLSNLHLEAEFIDEIRDLRSTRVPAYNHDNVDHIEVSHSLVLSSPHSGGEHLYASENLLRVVGMEPEASAALKEKLLAAILVDDNIYAHQWRMGDLMIYDNTQLLHRRDQFEGLRWLKATKIFAPPEVFAVPRGEVYQG